MRSREPAEQSSQHKVDAPPTGVAIWRRGREGVELVRIAARIREKMVELLIGHL